MRVSGNGKSDAIDTSLDVGLHLVLPKADDFPAHPPQATMVPVIAAAIGLYLRFPLSGKLGPPAWKPPSVPEVTVDEEGNFLLTENEIRASRQIARMSLAVQPKLGQHSGDAPFWTGVCSPDSRHHGTALLGRHDVPFVPPRLGRRDACHRPLT